MQHWDIFCRIVDNYGDIGVCWRLSKQLATEHGKSVRLWIDDLQTARKLIPELQLESGSQVISSVEICLWQNAAHADAADVVIEAFACELPAEYMAKMAEKPPVWINLEYLSAEPWISEFHARASRHPSLSLTKHFFFPGFAPDTGGLLREHDLIARRNAFQKSPEAKKEFQEKFHIPDSTGLKVSLFCYPHAPLAEMLDAFSNSSQPLLCLIPDSGIWPVISEYFGAWLEPGEQLSKGNLTLAPLPFLTQDEYDHLLWFSDINFVRGEDSWVRAIWAAKPMIWQPYRQQEDTHLGKLDAFLNVYCAELIPEAAKAAKRIHASWCGDTFPEAAWREYMQYLPALNHHAISFAAKLAKESDLASKLVIFCRNPS